MKKILLVAIFPLFAACVQQPVLPGSVPIPVASPIPQPIGGSIPGFEQAWSNIALIDLKAQLPKLNKAAKDMQRFCPNYLSMSEDQQVMAWGYLISGIVKFESGYQLSDAMTESNGAVSQGLFQLTYGDSHCPKSRSEANLNDPSVNIGCAVQIMGDEAGDDGVVAGGGYVKYGAPPARGLARYWSVLRVPDSNRSHHLSDIMAMAGKAPGCK